MSAPETQYSMRHRVSHADVDLLGEIKVSALLGLLEQAAVEASSEAGYDPAWYSRAGKVWLVRRTHLERNIPLGGGDTLEISTHVADFRRARSLRSYSIRRVNGDGKDSEPSEPAACATTDWVYCDVISGRPASVPEDMRRAFCGNSAAPTQPRKRLQLGSASSTATRLDLEVRPSNLDHMVHVNNAVYADFLEDGAFELFASRGFGLERMLAAGGALRIRSIDLEYLEDASPGDHLRIQSWLGPTDPWPGSPLHAHLEQAIERHDGVPLVQARSKWVWRSRPTVLGGAPEP